MPTDRWMWDTTSTLEALGAADVALWVWEPEKARLRLTGGITLSNVRRGVAQMGSVGYWCGKPFARHGHTLAAVRALSEFAFRTLGLHRLEAACIPENAPSRALLAKAGFTEEGFARAYLKINGAWRDHVLFGLTTPLRGAEGPDEGVSV